MKDRRATWVTLYMLPGSRLISGQELIQFIQAISMLCVASVILFSPATKLKVTRNHSSEDK